MSTKFSAPFVEQLFFFPVITFVALLEISSFLNGRAFSGLSVDQYVHLYDSTIQSEVLWCEWEVPEKATPMLKVPHID